MAKASNSDNIDLKKLRNFSETDINDIREGFSVFENSKSLASVTDLITFIESTGLSLKYPTVSSILAKVASSNPKGLNFKAFIESFQSHLGTSETKPGTKKLFETIDIEAKEYLDTDRLSSLSKEIGLNLTTEDLNYLIQQEFNCPDGKVTSEAFQKKLAKIKSN